MSKKTILYPLVKETTYHPENEWNVKRGIAGEPDEVKGTLISYDGYFGDNVELVENRVFDDTLTYIGYGRGRSSAVFYFEDSSGAAFQMFMTDMDDLLSKKDILSREVKGKWTYCKRGKNYGIKLVE